MLEDNFKKNTDKYDEKVKKYNKTYNFIGVMRLIIFLWSVFFTYAALNIGINTFYRIIAVVSYIAFIILVIYHRKISEKLSYAKGMYEINKDYISRINGEWINFKDIGEEFINKNHQYSYDLDIVGKESLFQLVNTTNTSIGRKTLAKTLLNPLCNKEEILRRQEAIKELKDNLELCQNIEYCTKDLKGKLENEEKLIEYSRKNDKLTNSKILQKIIYILPMITVPLLLFVLIFKVINFYKVMILIFAIQLFIWSIGLAKINNSFDEINKFKDGFDKYYKILKLLEKEEFKCEKLKEIKEILFSKNSDSLSAMKELDNIMIKIRLRFNPFLFFILNGLFLWDYQCIFSLEKWKEKYYDKLEKYIISIGEIESLMSLAVLNHINKDICYPKIKEDKRLIKAENLGHILINQNVRVNNDLNMDDNILVITGSNMSGKTTFLRTIGINLVLAYSGAPVCASDMTCSVMNIFTSMRISDELKNGVSTFYAELVRIKKIIDYSKEKKDMIFLIDEIFRGTNSSDRITGALNVLANLNRIGVIGCITTHDLELCTLDKYNRIKNYHFSEHYKENKIFFDYKMKSGKATSTNAKYLMNMIGIEILEE